MERLRLLNFGPKIYNKLILTYSKLPSLMFSIKFSRISNNNSSSNSLNNSREKRIKTNNSKSLHNDNIGKDH